MKLSTLATSCLAASMFTANTYAMDVDFSGFLSVVGGKTLGSDEEFIADRSFGSVGTYDNNISLRPESIVALQAKAGISEKVSATAQLLAKGQDEFDASFEWLYVTYQLTDETAFNAGRFRMPFYYYSDFLDVGYAYYWVRPPVDVYNIGHTSLNGVSLFDTRYFGDIGVSSQVWLGTDEVDLNGTNVDVRNDLGLTVTLEYDWAKVRFMHNRKRIVAQYTADNRPGIGELELVDLDNMSYNALAFMADYRNFLWRSEFTQLKYTYNGIYHIASNLDQSITSDEKQNAWYASVGYIIGQFTPHYTHSYMDGSTSMGAGDTDSDTVGVRWDVQPGTALKLEYSRQDMKELAASAISAAKNKLVTVAIDVVF